MGRQHGFSIIEIMIGMAVLTFLSLGLMRMLSASSKSARSTERLVDIKFLAKTFSENVDCHETLKPKDPIGSPAFKALSCKNLPMGSVTLRRKDNSPFLDKPDGKMGGFEIQAGCRDERLHIQALKLDPMIQKKEWVDVFGGTGELCRHYFSTGKVCQKGQRVLGSAGAVPVCGPEVLDCPWYSRSPVNSGGGCSETCQAQLQAAGAWVGVAAPSMPELESNSGSRAFYNQIRAKGAEVGCDPLRGTTYD